MDTSVTFAVVIAAVNCRAYAAGVSPPSPFFGRSLGNSRCHVSITACGCASASVDIQCSIQALFTEAPSERCEVCVLRQIARSDQPQGGAARVRSTLNAAARAMTSSGFTGAPVGRLRVIATSRTRVTARRHARGGVTPRHALGADVEDLDDALQDAFGRAMLEDELALLTPIWRLGLGQRLPIGEEAPSARRRVVPADWRQPLVEREVLDHPPFVRSL